MENSTSQSSGMLFNSELTENYFPEMKLKLNPDHEKSFIAILGKWAEGKSTLSNIYINLATNQPLSKKYFREGNSGNTVTQGANYFIFSDQAQRVDYVFIDCEGIGGPNSTDVMKLYLLIASISDVILFNFKTAFDDQEMTNCIQGILSNLDVLGIGGRNLAQIHMVGRDIGNASLRNYVYPQIIPDTDHNLLRATASRKYLSTTCPFANVIQENNIHFISRPIYRGNSVETSNTNSAFYEDVRRLYTSTFNSLPRCRGIDEKERRLNLLWNYDISRLNNDEYQIFIRDLVTRTLNETYPLQIEVNRQSVTSYAECVNTLNTKKINYKTFVINLLRTILLSIDDKVNRIVDQYINEKINAELSILATSYNAAKANYNSRYQSSARQEPIYKTETYQKPSIVISKTHRGNVEGLCTNCNAIFNQGGGCIKTRNHTGSLYVYDTVYCWSKFKYKDLTKWSCCGQRDWERTCSETQSHHPGWVGKWTGCLHLQDEVGCETVKSEIYTTSTREVVSSYRTVYSIPPWDEKMFSTNI